MKPIDPSSNRVSGTDWHILGELKLPVGYETNSKVSKWLTEILRPLDMHADFLSRILQSAQDAAVRALQAEAEVKFGHIHLLIFAPPEHNPKDKTWGFFRIEKIEYSNEDLSSAAHAIEFYLYVEG